MIISSTYFIHRDIYKHTWISPDGLTTNQIDYVLIDKRHASNILDVRSYRGANCNSDQYLIKIKYRSRIRNQKQERKEKQQRINIHKLKDENISFKYREVLNEKIKTLDYHSMNKLE